MTANSLFIGKTHLEPLQHLLKNNLFIDPVCSVCNFVEKNQPNLS